jgi:hypothetical protein
MQAMAIPDTRKTKMTAVWFPKKLGMRLSSVLGKRRRTTYACPVEDREAPCTGLAATFVAEATVQPAGVVGPMVVVVEEGIDTVGWPPVASAANADVGKVDCGVSDTVVVTVKKTV